MAQVSPEIANRDLINEVQPIYPLSAMDKNLQGRVVLDVLIGRDGNIKELKIKSGPPELAEAAVVAEKQWRYTPYYSLGDLVEVKTEIYVDFRKR